MDLFYKTPPKTLPPMLKIRKLVIIQLESGMQIVLEIQIFKSFLALYPTG